MILLPLMILWAPRPMQFAASARWSLLLFFAAALTVGAPDCLGIDARQPSARQTAARGGQETTEKVSELSREGTRVSSQVGTFRELNRRWVFTIESSATAYRLLENQTLERVCRAIQEEPQDTRWSVNGVLTEFMDENFLLLDKIQRATD